MTDLEHMISQCVAQNPAAQKQFYKMYAPAMRSLCRKYVNDQDDAKDIFQEGFIKVFENLGHLKTSTALHGWMRRIFVNTAQEYYRKKTTERRFIEPANSSEDSPPIPEHEAVDTYIEHVLTQVDADKLNNFIIALQYPKNRIVPLYCWTGLSHTDISKVLGISENNCKVHYHRAKHILKNLIQLELNNQRHPIK